MFTTDNNIYIGGTNVLLEWGKVSTDKSDLSEDKLKEIRSTVIERIQKLFRNYLELDNVSFLFGTGSSIHLGAASIQNIPLSMEIIIVTAMLKMRKLMARNKRLFMNTAK